MSEEYAAAFDAILTKVNTGIAIKPANRTRTVTAPERRTRPNPSRPEVSIVPAKETMLPKERRLQAAVVFDMFERM